MLLRDDVQGTIRWHNRETNRASHRMIFLDDYRMLALVSCQAEEQALLIGQSSVT